MVSVSHTLLYCNDSTIIFIVYFLLRTNDAKNFLACVSNFATHIHCKSKSTPTNSFIGGKEKKLSDFDKIVPILWTQSKILLCIVLVMYDVDIIVNVLLYRLKYTVNRPARNIFLARGAADSIFAPNVVIILRSKNNERYKALNPARALLLVRW